RHTRSKRDWSSDVCSSDLFVKKISYNKSHQLITIYKGRFSMRLIGKKIFIYPGIILSLLSGGIALNSGLAFFNAQSVQADTTSSSEERSVGKECANWSTEE